MDADGSSLTESVAGGSRLSHHRGRGRQKIVSCELFQPGRVVKRRDFLLSLFAVALLLLMGVSSAAQKNNAWDELKYILNGLKFLESGSPLDWDVTPITSINAIFVEGLDWSFERFDQDLCWTRLPTLVLSGIALLTSFWWTLHHLGRAPAVGALVLYLFSPNIMSHAQLVSPDSMLASLSVLFVCAIWNFSTRPSWARVASVGLILGLTLLTKFSAIIWIPLSVLLVGLVDSRAYVRFVPALFVAALVVWLGYGMNLLKDYPYVPDLGNYWIGIQNVRDELSVGYPGFIAGRLGHGWWYYYILLILIKTTIPLLILGGVGVILGFWHVATRKLTVLLGLPGLVFVFAASMSNMALGIRHVLPVYPLLVMLGGIGIFHLLKAKFLGKWLVLILLLWHGGASLFIYPHYLSYFNETVGGPNNGWQWAVDSNLDWGQDLKGLTRYVKENNIDSMYLAYFGHGFPQCYPAPYKYLPSAASTVKSDVSLESVSPEKLKGWVAISATQLQGVWNEAFGLPPDLYDKFKPIAPVTKIGYSIFVYDLR